jgi:hypothetical protein
MNDENMKLIRTGRRSAAILAAPWAAKIVKCEGGYMAFRHLTDYETWKNQK